MKTVDVFKVIDILTEELSKEVEVEHIDIEFRYFNDSDKKTKSISSTLFYRNSEGVNTNTTVILYEYESKLSVE